jgi:hypothetical protein
MLFFDGGLAADGRLDLYDASQSYYGFARVLQFWDTTMVTAT